jgi:Ca2+-binding EF-hand superfamily protein
MFDEVDVAKARFLTEKELKKALLSIGFNTTEKENNDFFSKSDNILM